MGGGNLLAKEQCITSSRTSRAVSPLSWGFLLKSMLPSRTLLLNISLEKGSRTAVKPRDCTVLHMVSKL